MISRELSVFLSHACILLKILLITNIIKTRPMNLLILMYKQLLYHWEWEYCLYMCSEFLSVCLIHVCSVNYISIFITNFQLKIKTWEPYENYIFYVEDISGNANISCEKRWMQLCVEMPSDFSFVCLMTLEIDSKDHYNK